MSSPDGARPRVGCCVPPGRGPRVAHLLWPTVPGWMLPRTRGGGSTGPPLSPGTTSNGGSHIWRTTASSGRSTAHPVPDRRRAVRLRPRLPRPRTTSSSSSSHRCREELDYDRLVGRLDGGQHARRLGERRRRRTYPAVEPANGRTLGEVGAASTTDVARVVGLVRDPQPARTAMSPWIAATSCAKP